MRFVVLGAHRTSGAPVLLIDTVASSLEEAVEMLRSAASSGLFDPSAYDARIVDLDAAMPVVVVEAPAGGAGSAAPGVDAAETLDALPAAVSEQPPSFDTADEQLSSPAAIEEETVSLTEDAFAAAVESDRPEMGAEPAVLEPEPPAIEPAVSLIDSVVEYSEELPAAAPPPETATPAPVDSTAGSEEDEEALLDALRRAADSLIGQGIEVPQPEPLPADVPDVSADLPETPQEAAVAEPLGAISLEPPVDEAEEASSAPDLEPPRPVIMGEYPEALPEEPSVEPAASQGPYEPSGELEIAGYTCDDCVYSSTCPKAGESSPADCGTFQWRSF